MTPSLCGFVGGVAKEYNPKQIPPVVPVGRGWNAHEFVMMHDKPFVVDAALTATDLSAAALLLSSLPQPSSSRDDNLLLSPKDSVMEPIASPAAAAAAAEFTSIVEMATMTTATISCQTSPNMKVLSRERIVIADKTQVTDPSKEKVSFIAKSGVADPSREKIILTTKSQLSDPSRETNVSTVKSQSTVAAVAEDYLRSIIPRRLKKRKRMKKDECLIYL